MIKGRTLVPNGTIKPLKKAKISQEIDSTPTIILVGREDDKAAFKFQFNKAGFDLVLSTKDAIVESESDESIKNVNKISVLADATENQAWFFSCNKLYTEPYKDVILNKNMTFTNKIAYTNISTDFKLDVSKDNKFELQQDSDDNKLIRMILIKEEILEEKSNDINLLNIENGNPSKQI